MAKELFLSEDEIELLMDGLDSVGKARDMSSMFGAMLGASLESTEDGKRAELEKYKQAEALRKRENRLLEERIILIKAKLIQMKDKSVAENAL